MQVLLEMQTFSLQERLDLGVQLLLDPSTNVISMVRSPCGVLARNLMGHVDVRLLRVVAVG